MFFNKAIKNLNTAKNLSIKNFLVLSLLIPSIGVNQEANANFFKKQLSWLNTDKENFIIPVVFLTAFGGLIAFAIANQKAYNRACAESARQDRLRQLEAQIEAQKKAELNAKNNGPKQCDILKNFHNDPEHNYANLQTMAKNLYLEQDQTISIKIDFAFPVVWLFNKASKTAECLTNQKEESFKQLGLELKERLTFLMKNNEFRTEKINYDIEKKREEEEKKSMEKMYSILNNIESKLGNIESKFGNIESRLGGISSKLGEIYDRQK